MIFILILWLLIKRKLSLLFVELERVLLSNLCTRTQNDYDTSPVDLESSIFNFWLNPFHLWRCIASLIGLFQHSVCITSHELESKESSNSFQKNKLVSCMLVKNTLFNWCLNNSTNLRTLHGIKRFFFSLYLKFEVIQNIFKYIMSIS